MNKREKEKDFSLHYADYFPVVLDCKKPGMCVVGSTPGCGRSSSGLYTHYLYYTHAKKNFLSWRTLTFTNYVFFFVLGTSNTDINVTVDFFNKPPVSSLVSNL